MITVDVMVSWDTDYLVRCETKQFAHAIEKQRGRIVVSPLSPDCDVTDNKNRVHISELNLHPLYVFKHPLAHGALKISVR